MPASARVSGTFRNVTAISTRVGGSWKSVTAGWSRVSGVWRQFFTSVQPPFQLLESVVLSSDASSVTFSNVSSTYAANYKHLQIRYTARRNASGSVGTVLRFNGDTGSNYSRHGIGGNGSSVYAFGAGSDTSMFVGSSFGSGAAAGAFVGAIIDIVDAFSTSKFKTVRTFSGRPSEDVALHSGMWRNTSTINTILIYPDVGGTAFVAGSRFSLYGIRGS